MRFSIRFKIGNRLGAASQYSLREFCVSVVDRYSLTEAEVLKVVSLKPGETFTNEDLTIKRSGLPTNSDYELRAKHDLT